MKIKKVKAKNHEKLKYGILASVGKQYNVFEAIDILVDSLYSICIVYDIYRKCVCVYIYIYISGHKWSTRHRVLKSHRSKMRVIYTCYHENNVPSQLSPQWLYGNSCTWAHDVPLHIAGTNEPKSAQQAKQGA